MDGNAMPAQDIFIGNPPHGRFNRAAVFCIRAHGEQKRKYTGVPYWTHPIEVAMMVREYGGDEDTQIAALLHDTVEDTGTTPEEIEERFGANVRGLVLQVTDVSRPEDGNRAARKAKDLAHLANCDARGSLIKVCDLISNSKDIMKHDPKFGIKYLAEKGAVLDVLRPENPVVMARAREIIRSSRS